jgi:N-acyl homoserine lactone hydrolase
MPFQPISKSLHINKQPIKVHAISVGEVAVKERFRAPKKHSFWAEQFTLFSRKFTEWMPIWVWVIEHPEGIYVLDTGEIAAVNTPDYFKSSGRYEHWYNRSQFKFKITREEEIDAQLQNLGIETDTVKQVLISHMHLDHCDGLCHFPNTEIIVHDLEWEKPYGSLPKLYPDWLSPTLVHLNEPFGPFDKTLAITQDKKLRMIHTPGHSWGHCSFLLETDEGTLFFAMDVCYHQAQLLDNQFAGGSASLSEAAISYQRIQTLAKQAAIVFLPAHDSAAGARLLCMETLKIID